MKKSAVVLILVIVVFLIIATPFFFSKPYGFFNSVVKIFSLPSVLNEIENLKKENSDLKGELSAIQNSYSLPSDSKYVYAKIFSLYPFDVKNRIYINLGKNDGIALGDPVMFSKTILIGQISSIYDDSSEVITIFDPSYSLPVKIGKSGIDGLLTGGVSPQVGLIDKTKQVSVGDPIYSASKDLPYGLLIGSVKNVGEDSTGAFFKAQIDLSYALSDINNVYVVKK